MSKHSDGLSDSDHSVSTSQGGNWVTGYYTQVDSQNTNTGNTGTARTSDSGRVSEAADRASDRADGHYSPPSN
jgi:hypothetical protein